jgi:hypothetical protein
METATSVPNIFEVGKSYSTRFACDYDLVSTITVTKRTEKTLWFDKDGKAEQRKIHVSTWGSQYEYVIDGNYSMANVWSAQSA